MDITTLSQFRHEIYNCFKRAKDALFNTVDALMAETQAKSFPEVSQSLWFERKWSSLYEAFQDGRIDKKGLRGVLLRYLPTTSYVGKWLWIGIDASSIKRPEAITSADRTAQHVHNLPECKTPITFGWQFSTLVVLPQTPSSWTSILDQERVSSDTTAIEGAYAQLARRHQSTCRKTPLLPWIVATMSPGDWCRCSGLGIGFLNRIKLNRCFYRAAPPPTGNKGAPRKDGAKLQGVG